MLVFLLPCLPSRLSLQHRSCFPVLSLSWHQSSGNRRESLVALDAHRLLGYCYVAGEGNAGWGRGVDGGRRARWTGLDKASGISGWRLHDLRRSAASHMQELGIAPDTIRAILNHAMPGVGGVYMRSELETAKRDALAKWAGEVEKLTAATTRAAA